MNAFERFTVEAKPMPPVPLRRDAPREMESLLREFERVAARLTASYSDVEAALCEKETLNSELQSVVCTSWPRSFRTPPARDAGKSIQGEYRNPVERVETGAGRPV